jgi:acyltransferase
VSERKGWIDWARAIGIWLVVFGHLPGGNVAVTNVIYAFHMPLFFFLSGFLLKPKSVLETARFGVSRLLIPYAIFYLITWVWWFFVGFMRHPEIYDHSNFFQEAFVRPFFGMLLGVGYHTDLSTMINIPLWFLVGVFETSIIFSMLCSLKSGALVAASVLFLAVGQYFQSRTGADLLWSVDSSIMALPFYAIGYYCSRAKSLHGVAKVFNARSGPLAFMAMLGFLSVTVAVAMTNGRVDINGMVYGNSPILFYAGGISGILAVICLATVLSRIMEPESIIQVSRGTIVILGLHAAVTGLFLSIMNAFSLHYNLVISATISCLVLMTCLPLIHFVEMKLPILNGRRTSSST